MSERKAARELFIEQDDLNKSGLDSCVVYVTRQNKNDLVFREVISTNKTFADAAKAYVEKTLPESVEEMAKRAAIDHYELVGGSPNAEHAHLTSHAIGFVEGHAARQPEIERLAEVVLKLGVINVRLEARIAKLTEALEKAKEEINRLDQSSSALVINAIDEALNGGTG